MRVVQDFTVQMTDFFGAKLFDPHTERARFGIGVRRQECAFAQVRYRLRGPLRTVGDEQQDSAGRQRKYGIQMQPILPIG